MPDFADPQRSYLARKKERQALEVQRAAKALVALWGTLEKFRPEVIQTIPDSDSDLDRQIRRLRQAVWGLQRAEKDERAHVKNVKKRRAHTAHTTFTWADFVAYTEEERGRGNGKKRFPFKLIQGGRK